MKLSHNPAAFPFVAAPSLPATSSARTAHSRLGDWRLVSRAGTTWTEFYKITQRAGPRRLLLDALEHAGDRVLKQGYSLDLGAGAGGATKMLHDRTAWQVHAIDVDPAAKRFIAQRFGEALPPRVCFEQSCFLSAHLPPRSMDFIWAGLALPYVPQTEIGPLWQKVRDALQPGAIFAGDFFGPEHGHFGRADMNFHDPAQLAALFDGLHLIKCERHQQISPFSCGRPLMMDCYHVIAMKPPR